MDSITIKLTKPVKIGETEITEVVIGDIKGKHLKKMPAQPRMADLIEIASKASKIESAFFDEMDSKDLAKVLDAVGEKL